MESNTLDHAQMIQITKPLLTKPESFGDQHRDHILFAFVAWDHLSFPEMIISVESEPLTMVLKPQLLVQWHLYSNIQAIIKLINITDNR